MRHTMRDGFSLMELGFVLAIFGLMLGGVITGQSMIRAAELRNITVEREEYQTALYSFRRKYVALPGDYAQATNSWGALDSGTGTTPVCYAMPATGKATCNGNGDDSINYNPGTEIFRAWQHLANAGLIEGSYNGINGVEGLTAYDHDIGINAPESKVSEGGWTIRTHDGSTGNSEEFATSYGNELVFGGESGGITSGGILKPQEAWNIDYKVDDAQPGRGKVIAYNISSCTTAANNTELDSAYKLDSSDSDACALRFVWNF